MSPQPWRRTAVATLAASTLVGGLALGVAAPTALAQPADSSSSTEQTQAAESSSSSSSTEQTQAPISPDQVLMMISQEYQTGKGGGQVSKLIEQVMTLRMRGIRPSRGNAVALAAALEKRPNQVPLIQALEETLTYQRKQMMRSQNQVPSGGGAPPVATPGIPSGPAWQPGNPMQQDSDTIFPMPGR